MSESYFYWDPAKVKRELGSSDGKAAGQFIIREKVKREVREKNKKYNNERALQKMAVWDCKENGKPRFVSNGQCTRFDKDDAFTDIKTGKRYYNVSISPLGNLYPNVRFGLEDGKVKSIETYMKVYDLDARNIKQNPFIP